MSSVALCDGLSYGTGMLFLLSLPCFNPASHSVFIWLTILDLNGYYSNPARTHSPFVYLVLYCTR